MRGAYMIVVGQFIVNVEPTDTFTVMNVFIGRIGARIVQRSRQNIYVIQSPFEDLGVFLVRQGSSAAAAESAKHARGRFVDFDVALQDVKLRSVKSGPGSRRRTGGSGTARTITNGFPYRSTAYFVTHLAAKTPSGMRLFRCHDSSPSKIQPDWDIGRRERL